MKGFQKIVHILKRQNVLALFICIVGIAINLVLNTVAVTMDLPLYLDTVGTVSVAVLGGYLPGVIVGLVTNIIKSISNPTSLYYVSVNVLIAFFATFISKRGWLKHVAGIIGMTLAFVLIGGGLGNLIPWFMEGLSFYSKSMSEMLYETGYFDALSSHILSSIVMEIPDKVATVLIVLIILYLVPEKYTDRLGFVWWAQKPLKDAEFDLTDKSKTRISSLKLKVILTQALSLIVISVVGVSLSVGIYRETIIDEHSRIATGTAKAAAAIIDGDRVDEFIKKGHDAKGYDDTLVILDNILQNSTEIEHLYVYKVLEDGCRVVYDIETDDIEAKKTGAIVELEERFHDYVPKLLAGKEIEPIVTDDSRLYLLTAYYPVYDSQDRCVCYVGADVTLGVINSKINSYLTEMISVYIGLFVVLCVLMNWMAEYQVSLPLKTITNRVYSFVSSDNTQKELDEKVKSLREIDVRTGDEVELLYNAVCNMSSNQTEQIRSIRRLSDSTAKMQDGLVITMADMVENRDSDTGAHIQKTAAYVKIIVDGLKKKGYYAEKLTPKFMSDAVRSAPLHDVGKIDIPDEILNKPGKLTDEEYEIMKTHTTAGKRIVENAISTVEGDNYLKEARNMAAYHHERWDGKGYPEGLHGEVIPLSARIMAVADVFDALTSPRIYKEAFSLVKALLILEEGKGTQFDPKCVEVFMDSLDEVKVVLSKYNPEAL
ncbi:HD domain-containing protein [Acetitomaculum ruminis DSM 5522]|uniref:HD domain-containing protein n=1 Tax=Acetitomaculum ruminis DSM 5522 TaxID=1120918 RepID=A0A1I0ZZ49_9FIRM|nr:HD domain-containing phosphohydrolase [Acetitomaculum ruminis]SFB30911.1 HD domain-containing protein [Acetitomaculum ruminis DSM 5522]